MSGESHAPATNEPAALGPIRPEHATDGWRLEGDSRGWCVSKRVGAMIAKVRGTTPTTCVWGVYEAGGRMLREASSNDVEYAKTTATLWIESNQT